MIPDVKHLRRGFGAQEPFAMNPVVSGFTPMPLHNRNRILKLEKNPLTRREF